MVTVRSVVAVAAAKHWPIFQMDVHNAFLQDDLYDEVYMHVPPGFGSQRGIGKVCRLNKSLYGLKQAPRQWNKKLTEALIDFGFCQSHFDYSLFIKRADSQIVVVLVYVDDLLVTGSSSEIILQTRNDLKLKFKMKDLGKLKFFLCIEFSRSQQGIHMSQRKYALELIAEMGLGGAKPASTPMETNIKLTSADFDDHIKGSQKEGTDRILDDAGPYQKLVGRLLYLTMTRVDIAYVVQVLSQFMHKPKQSHMEAALRVVRYIKAEPGLGLLMPSEDANKLTAYCDSDWRGCIESRRFVTGYIVMFGNVLVSWKSKKQDTVSRSSAEAEFRSMASTVAEITWLEGLYKELGVSISRPVQLFCDSKATIQIAANPIFHERTKHIDIDCHFVREKIVQNLVQTQHVSTKEQLADLLTKSLGKLSHDYLMSKLGLKNLFQPLA